MDNLGYLLHKLSVMTKTELSNQLKQYELTAQQWSVLKDISLHPEGTTPAMIANRLLSDRPTVSGIIKRLLEKKLIVTTHNPSDKRSLLIFLTDETKKSIPKMENISDDVIQDAITNIPNNDVQTTIRVLQNMIANLKMK
ncbi:MULTISPECIES: MarR family transcriptional regulator [Bacillales]|uniref:MarR family winged helix-turn-helix transcriptional regulator n=1 Tax=Bacillales TaxID=1385 RepID=UPI00190A1582|nr:MarR family transcriptional regulator [Staphylococcus aureus]WAI26794.1 MAG: MarR family transcriptional regulator [Bacillus paranthracis]MBK3313206.1 MarR family transcriptional regulator [Staphylococcus aureus]WAI29741.1 MAG: MarR family transcriptional regulator [Bacillus paranthracis]WAI30239.1 MAG: MarR family transcriptional regulator [Bacillus paranthracis]WAI35443.1 MAG: MarR family transcriptional regulator [Bacillus paranthracis]